MKIFDPCVQARLVNWQCDRAVRLIEKFGIPAVMRGLLWFTSLSSVLAAIGSVAAMTGLFRYVSSRDPDMAVWVMLFCLLLGAGASWAWSSAWGLGVLHHRTREECCKAHNNPHRPEVFYSPRSVWQFRLLNLLLDSASMSMLRQRALDRATITAIQPTRSSAPPRF